MFFIVIQEEQNVSLVQVQVVMSFFNQITTLPWPPLIFIFTFVFAAIKAEVGYIKMKINQTKKRCYAEIQEAKLD